MKKQHKNEMDHQPVPKQRIPFNEVVANVSMIWGCNLGLWKKFWFWDLEITCMFDLGRGATEQCERERIVCTREKELYAWERERDLKKKKRKKKTFVFNCLWKGCFGL